MRPKRRRLTSRDDGMPTTRSAPLHLLGTLAAVIHPYPTQAEAIKHVAGWCPAGPIRQLRLVSA
jgi:hypothetical protein